MVRTVAATIAEELAEFLVNVKYQDFPSAVVHQAKRCILDYLGATIKGSESKAGRIAIALAESLSGPQESTLIGVGRKVSSPNAALANGMMGHAMQIDDGHRYAQGHPGTTVIPAALAVAEQQNSGGRDLIKATILGYEVFVRVGVAVNPSHNSRGFHPTGTLGAFGSTVAAGILAGLSKNQMANALGSAGSLASGLMEYISDGSMSKYLIPGNAAKNGVLAAFLARDGFSGPHLVFEGKKGFFKAFSDKHDPKALTDGLPKTGSGLAQQYKITECYIKPYPVCGHAIPTIDAVLKLLRKQPVKPDDIERVRIRTYALALDESDDPSPKTTTSATLSLQYTTAATLIFGRLTPDEMTEEMLFDPTIRDLMKKIDVILDPELDKLMPKKRSAIVELKMKDGSFRKARQDSPKGQPENPLTDDELREKFYALVTHTLGRKRAEEIDAKVSRLEDIRSARELAECFGP